MLEIFLLALFFFINNTFHFSTLHPLGQHIKLSTLIKMLVETVALERSQVRFHWKARSKCTAMLGVYECASSSPN